MDVTSEAVGMKAWGLTTLPPGWTPPFFVVDHACKFGDEDGGIDPALSASQRGYLQSAIQNLGVPSTALVIVRSSGTAETMRERGSLVSMPCRSDQVAATISKLQKDIAAVRRAGVVHWIVQPNISARQSGHLSNERRVKKEVRDWIAQFDPEENQRSSIESFAVRAWRDGPFIPVDRLECAFGAHLPRTLKSAAMWATEKKVRIHFEWIWDGSCVYLVQADQCEDTPGTKPASLLPAKVDKGSSISLKKFRIAQPSDFDTYGKLKNARLYKNLGYEMPDFFILDDDNEIREVLSGSISPELNVDLQALTTEPLVIRTDGRAIPKEKKEMLPRSDELRSASSAVEWLTRKFASTIQEGGLSESGVCLLAHHFVPAVASAWAHAEPNQRMVRIESLWGVPEGLYWFSHDTYEIDTHESDPSKFIAVPVESYKAEGRYRFKGTFVAPNAEGKWITHETAAPFDWRSSVSKLEWVREISRTTRRIAISEGKPVNVMWLVDVHPDASSHAVLPWFHCEAELSSGPSAAPRKKISWHKDYVIRTTEDWTKLQTQLREGIQINRVTVEPTEADLIRNTSFADELADVSKRHNCVVELSGGVLSHVYYVLTRAGCNVECVDLFGVEEDTVEFNKIVRDQIPTQIQGRGEQADVVTLSGDDLVVALKEKLVEEAIEALDARSSEDLIGELADVSEVLLAICTKLGISLSDVEQERQKKKKKRGGFDDGVMLVRTMTPHSLSTRKELPLEQDELNEDAGRSHGASGGRSRPSGRLSMKPDLRSLTKAFERLVSFETDFSSLSHRKGQAKFNLPLEDGETSEFNLEIELRRSKSRIRGVVKLKGAPIQFSLPLSEKKP